MDENKQESAQEPVKVELPTPVFTEPSVAQPTSAPDTEMLAKKVAELLKPEIERAVQSTKDRRFAQIERSLGQLADLEAQGATIPDSVKQEARIRDYVDSRLQSAPVARDGITEPKFDPTSLLREIGLVGNEPEVIREWMKPHRNDDHLRAELTKIRNAQLTASPGASAAPAMSGGNSLSTEEDVMEEAKKLAAGNPGNNFFDVKTALSNGGGVVKHK
jgi:hypothetical protein